MGQPTWIYHATEAAKIVDSDECEQHYKEGWADSPAAFKDEPETTSEPDNPSEMTAEERVKKVENAIIEVMTEGDEAKKTAQGMPKVEVLEAIVRFDITAEERTEIFNRLNAEREAAQSQSEE